MNKYSHSPVMLTEVIDYLAPKDGKTYIDCTFGAGGYSKAILEAAECRIVAIDRDSNAKEFADGLSEKYGERFSLIIGRFANLVHLAESIGLERVDGVVFDIGVSSMQIDRAERGFSFQKDGPLDMRMGGEGKSASDFVNDLDEKEIADFIYLYGGEKFSRRIAKKIVEARNEKRLETTSELAEIVRKAVGRYNDKIDPATRTFQAIRIWVNDELEELKNGLAASEKILSDNGRLVVVTFHSLEDKIVKDFINIRSKPPANESRHLPEQEKLNKNLSFRSLSKKAVVPSKLEIDGNPRARSAKLRAAEKYETELSDRSFSGRKSSLSLIKAREV